MWVAIFVDDVINLGSCVLLLSKSELGKACSVLLFGLWTSRSLETVSKSQGGCSCLVGGVSYATVTTSLKEAAAVWLEEFPVQLLPRP